MSKPDGGRAFPVPHSIDGNSVGEPLAEFRGMTLRQWYAGQALMGMMMWAERNDQWRAGLPETTAHRAYTLADAMIAEGSK